ncbi:MAG: DUF7133 domain-containing protein [Phycisphaerales bacterium]
MPTLSHSVARRGAPAFALLGAAGLMLAWLGRGTASPSGTDSQPEPLSPRDALAALVIQPGFSIKAAATEPMVQAPVCMNFDEHGRLFVLEMRSYMPDAIGSREQMPSSRVVVLEDLDYDGVFEKSTTFLDGLTLPRSVAPCRGGALVLAPPDVLYCRDTDGDGRADQRRVLITGLDGLNNPEHAPNALVCGLDNWWHLSQCPVEFKFDGDTVVTRPTAAHGQWGMTMDDAGLLYYTPNSSALLGDILPKHAAELNPGQRGFGGVYETICSDNTTWPAHATPGVNRGYQDGVLRADKTLASLTAACGPSCNRAGTLGEELRGDFFICEPAGNLVKRLKNAGTEAAPRAVNAYERSEFLASRDERFRPVWSTFGPDGALYVADMYRGVIQHKTYLSTYLRAQVIERGLELPLDFGRIYRISADGARPAPRLMPGSMNTDQLVATLAHPDGWWRDTAQRLIVERRAVASAPAIRALLSHPAAPVRLQALWTLEGLGLATEAQILTALADPSPRVIRSALRVSESLSLTDPLSAALRERCGDADPVTAAYAVLALAPRLGDERSAFIASVLGSRNEQRPVRFAAIACAKGLEIDLIAAFTSVLGKPGKGATAAVGELADCVIDQSPESRTSLATATAQAVRDARWTAEPLLSKWRSSARLSTSTPRVLEMATNPTELASLAADHPGVAEIVRMMSWPGHIAEGAPPKPVELTAQEKSRFSRGEQLYHNCVACHMKDGRGTPRQVPSLAGSTRVLGSPEALTKILLHGLTGDLESNGQTYRGQMPATTISGDDDLAAILTYIRRSFGNDAPPVHPDDVGRVREATKDRNRSWTQAELEQKP